MRNIFSSIESKLLGRGAANIYSGQIFNELATILQESRDVSERESARDGGKGRGMEAGTMRREGKKQIATSASHNIIPIFPMGRQ